MENLVKADFEAVKAKGWKNNHFALKNVRTKWIKRGFDVVKLWEIQTEIMEG